MAKAILFLADGMADVPLEQLGGKTPLEYVDTPYMDRIAKTGVNGTFLTLPKGFPTSSDVANMSVMGYSLPECYPGRGPIEAVSQNIKLNDNDIAWRCNLINVKDGAIEDYSAGHLDESVAQELMQALQDEFGSELLTFHSGVSYRNLLVLHGKQFSPEVTYAKPDSSHGELVKDLLSAPRDNSKEAIYTATFLNDLLFKTADFLANHPINKKLDVPANFIWPWSPGYRPNFKKFSDKYAGKSGAIISAVDVIKGIGLCADMSVIDVPGATGFIDTNYAGKVSAALEAIKTHDFVYVHIEAIDECSHMGDLELKCKAIGDFENKVVKPIMDGLEGEDITFALLPDHPVPIELRKHTRTPVPLAICGPNITTDSVDSYSEREALNGSLGQLQDDQLIKFILGIQ